MIEKGDYLELTSPDAPPVRFVLEKARIQIGRSSDSDIRLSGAYVSRRHARIERGPNHGWRIIDLGSANGSFVNARRTDVAALGHGDTVSIGTHRLVLNTTAARPATDFDLTITTNRELVPTGPAARVADRTTLAPDHLIPARLLTDLHQASRRLNRAPDIAELLQRVSREFHALLHPRRLAVGREDRQKCQWPIVIDAQGQPVDGSDLTRQLVPRVQALQGSIAVNLKDLMAQEAKAPETLLFPIKSGDRRLGHVYVELEPDAPPAADSTTQFLSLLARQAALTWENLELTAARAAADEMHREMSAARQIQLRLFPDRHDLDPLLELAAQNIPALAVSGDYYDYQLLDQGQVLFILADVMGHGLAAALLMAGVQAVFRTGVRAHWPLEQLDRNIHHVVESSGDGEAFVVGILGLCDLRKNRLTLLSAGHPWPSVCSGSKAIARVEEAYTFPWGTFPSRDPSPVTFPLAPGDWSLVAYTDGIPDTRGASGQVYGAERLVALHHRNRRAHAEEICEEILSDVLGSSDDSAPQEDDITLLVLRGLPTA